ncbi:hypothetical protein XELAEV_18002117mg [Xenopus laevis]|nr:hypothetical protein XELAEV_18002117mg [Xenopus laevis]
MGNQRGPQLRYEFVINRDAPNPLFWIRPNPRILCERFGQIPNRIRTLICICKLGLYVKLIGGATVLVDKTKYMSEEYSQLTAPGHYELSDNDPTVTIKKVIDLMVSQACENGVIPTQCQGTYMGAAVAPAFANLHVHCIPLGEKTVPREQGEKFNHPLHGTPVQLQHYATCDTCNAVYLLKCPCGMVYVGQTGRPVKTRIKEHHGNSRNYKKGTYTDTAVARHFSESNHNLNQLKWLVLEVLYMPPRG